MATWSLEVKITWLKSGTMKLLLLTQLSFKLLLDTSALFRDLSSTLMITKQSFLLEEMMESMSGVSMETQLQTLLMKHCLSQQEQHQLSPNKKTKNQTKKLSSANQFCKECVNRRKKKKSEQLKTDSSFRLSVT